MRDAQLLPVIFFPTLAPLRHAVAYAQRKNRLESRLKFGVDTDMC